LRIFVVNEGIFVVNEGIYAGDAGLKQARQVKTGNATAGFSTYSNIKYGFECDKNTAGHRGTINGWNFYSLPWEQG
jgi:hypothetical protein